ncbi:MAG TPA: hypothetical protein VK548_13005 [Candidatus Acidoferrum sp.]|nr:hypothetical protein [Candidatus Acidoferrum sp.]
MIAFLALNAGAVLAALVIAAALGYGGRLSALAFATLAGYLVLVHSLTLFAGLLRSLTVVGVAMLLTLALAAALVLALYSRRSDERPRASWPTRPRAAGSATDAGLDPRPFTVAGLIAATAAVVVFTIWAWPHLFEATRFWVWDDYTYHMVYPALWLQERTIAAVTPEHAFTMQAWYPLSASVVSTWFMLPFHPARADALAWVSLTGVLYAALVAVGAAELFARLGRRPGAWAVPVVLLATSTRVTVMASSFSDADLSHAAALFAAFAFAVPRRDDESRREVIVDAWWAGLLSGIALGVKVSAAPQALIVLAMTALRAKTTSGRVGVGRASLVFGVSWAVTAGYWYVRNVVHTGNPVYPAAFLVWPGARFPETTLLEYGRHYGVRRAVTDALAVYLNWPPLHGVLAVLGLLGVAGWLILRRRSASRSCRYFAWGTVAIAATILALLPAAPYSAGNAMTFRAGFIHWDSMRYVALLPLLGWTALGFLVDTSAVRWLERLPAWTPRTVGQRALVVGAGALVLSAIVGISHDTKAAASGAAVSREPLFGAAAAVLDRQPPGTRVAVFGDQWIYPAFGDRAHLHPVRLDRDGRVATGPIGAAMEPGELTVDPATFRANLGASGVDVVVLVRQPHPGRAERLPSQDAALGTISDARVLHRDRAVAVWRLGP